MLDKRDGACESKSVPVCRARKNKGRENNNDRAKQTDERQRKLRKDERVASEDSSSSSGERDRERG